MAPASPLEVVAASKSREKPFLEELTVWKHITTDDL